MTEEKGTGVTSSDGSYEKSLPKKVSIEDLLKEGEEPIKLFIAKDKYLEYKFPTEDEVQKLEADARQQVDVNNEDRRLRGKPLFTSKEFDDSLKEVAQEKKLFYGLKKANPDLTIEKFKQLPSGLVTRMKLEIVGYTFKDMTEEQRENLKNMSQMMTDVTA